MFLKLLFALNWIAAAVLLYFFGEGQIDGSISADNMALWLGMIFGVTAIIVGGHVLVAKGKRVAAGLLLSILALPVALYGLFILALIILQPNWH
ncbi:osmoprotectant transporter permease [Sphingobium boeckii]|uniref:Osmoprotectant transporter permease n=1 Tax=Sphingobium boeckii TaxID=1082345 RepID=A0A7W9AEJ7_9SPHN|nr:osmoprotectant transporter permease [Sphingobium boeckii]MBB5684247.1 hypothetical protein [Sphingobium boeckii]